MTDAAPDAAPDAVTEPTDDPGGFAARAAASLPFNRHLGLRCVPTSAGQAEVVLPESGHLTNHLGTVHAVAELAPAEAAGGIAAVSGLADLVADGWLPIARSLTVRYVHLARGELVARASLADDVAAAAREAARAGERVAFTLPVTVEAADGPVAEVEIDYVFKHIGAGT